MLSAYLSSLVGATDEMGHSCVVATTATEADAQVSLCLCSLLYVASLGRKSSFSFGLVFFLPGGLRAISRNGGKTYVLLLKMITNGMSAPMLGCLPHSQSLVTPHLLHLWPEAPGSCAATPVFGTTALA